MHIDVLLGLQWGDEGKGKIVDYLADDYDLICRSVSYTHLTLPTKA